MRTTWVRPQGHYHQFNSVVSGSYSIMGTSQLEWCWCIGQTKQLAGGVTRMKNQRVRKEVNEKMAPNPSVNRTAQQQRFAPLLGSLRACGAPAAGYVERWAFQER